MLPLPALPVPVAAALDAVRTLTATPPCTPSERAAWLVGMRQIVDAAESTFTMVLADFDAAGDGEALHAAASTQAWLRGAIGLARGEASERVQIARASRGLLATSVAAMSGSTTDTPPPDAQQEDLGGSDEPAHVSYHHLQAIHRTVRSLPTDAQQDAAATLTQLAGQMGVDDLRAAGRYLTHVVDPDGGFRTSESDYSRRWLAVAPMLDGLHAIEGVLDAECASLLQSALAPFLVPTGPDDFRSAAQRRADGLAEIVTAAIAAGELPLAGGAPASLQVQVPLATLIAPDSLPAGPGQLLTPTSAAPFWLSNTAVQRISCGASVRRIVLDAVGIPVELGRSTRLFSAPQRQLLAARDCGCRFPGCGRPPQHTDAHHLVPWSAGGLTDLSNGLLLCRFHHRRVHEGGWSIRPITPESGANNTVIFSGPDGQRMTSSAAAARAGPAP